jgi:hypothetical protein
MTLAAWRRDSGRASNRHRPGLYELQGHHRVARLQFIDKAEMREFRHEVGMSLQPGTHTGG